MFYQFSCLICLFVCLFFYVVSPLSLGICPFQTAIKDIPYFPVNTGDLTCVNTYLLPLTSFLTLYSNSIAVQFTSTTPGDEVTAAPQNSPNYIIIGASAAGGVLMIIIIAVIIRKCLCKTRTSSAKQPRNIGRVNDCLEGDIELSNITGKI